MSDGGHGQASDGRLWWLWWRLVVVVVVLAVMVVVVVVVVAMMNHETMILIKLMVVDKLKPQQWWNWDGSFGHGTRGKTATSSVM